MCRRISQNTRKCYIHIDTGGEAGGAHDSGAQGVTLVQPYVTGAGNDGVIPLCRTQPESLVETKVANAEIAVDAQGVAIIYSPSSQVLEL